MNAVLLLCLQVSPTRQHSPFVLLLNLTEMQATSQFNFITNQFSKSKSQFRKIKKDEITPTLKLYRTFLALGDTEVKFNKAQNTANLD